MRDIAINLRAQARQRDLIDMAASQLGRNRSDFMLEAACEKAQNVLLDQTFFALDVQAFASFAVLCDAPLQKNSALDELLAAPSPWDVKSSKLRTTKTAKPLQSNKRGKSVKRVAAAA